MLSAFKHGAGVHDRDDIYSLMLGHQWCYLNIYCMYVLQLLLLMLIAPPHTPDEARGWWQSVTHATDLHHCCSCSPACMLSHPALPPLYARACW